MKSLLHQLTRFVRRKVWALLVAYMLGIHNFYKAEDRTPDDIIATIEHIEEQEDGAPQ